MERDREEVLMAALEAVIPFQRAGVNVSMRVGKSWIGLKHMEYYYTDTIRYLIVAPKLNILEGWKKVAREHNMEYLLEHVHFTTYLSLEKQQFDYDVVYLDECHSLIELSHALWLRNCGARILGLTGTAPKYHHSEKGKMVDEFCPIKFEYHVDEAVGDGILNDYRIIVHPLQLSSVKNLWKKKKDGSGWMSSELQDYDNLTRWYNNAMTTKERQISSVMRMKALMGYPTKEKYARQLFHSIKQPVIVFANTQEQADRLCQYSYHSKNDGSEANLELFREGKIDHLSCVLQLSEGVHVPAKESIIMHSYGNNKKLAQRLGRCLSLNPEETATIHVLVFENTIDSTWVTAALSDFAPERISWKEELIK